MDLLPYLGRGITVGEFVQMNTGRHCVCMTAGVSSIRTSTASVVQEAQLTGREETVCLPPSVLNVPV